MDTMQNAPGNENNPFKDVKFDDFMQYQGIIYIATLPLSVVASWLAYFMVGDRRLNFTEHFVLNLYYSSQIIIITAVVSIIMMCFNLNYLIFSALITLPMFLYLWFVLKRVFNDAFWDSFSKWILTIIIYGFFYLGVMIIISIIPYIYKIG